MSEKTTMLGIPTPAEEPADAVPPPAEPVTGVSLIDPDEATTEPRPSRPREEPAAVTLWPPRPREVLSGRYEIERVRAQGGMGVVVEAMDRSLRRLVAVKILHPTFAARPDWHERFATEARSMAALDHPNVVPVYDVGVDGDRHYFVMKLLEGETVFARLGRGPVPLREAVTIATQVLAGLEHMHARGVVHRDIKAGNIVLTRDGRVVIVDFGILRRMGSEKRLTQLDEHVGTVGYIAPELIRSEPGDARTDLYSLGVTLYQMLTGDLPFHGASPMETLSLQLESDPRPPSELEPSIPRSVDAVLLKALSREPAHRYASAAEMSEALRVAADGRRSAPPATSTPPSPSPKMAEARPPAQGWLEHRGTLLVLAVAAALGLLWWLINR